MKAILNFLYLTNYKNLSRWKIIFELKFFQSWSFKNSFKNASLFTNEESCKVMKSEWFAHIYKISEKLLENFPLSLRGSISRMYEKFLEIPTLNIILACLPNEGKCWTFQAEAILQKGEEIFLLPFNYFQMSLGKWNGCKWFFLFILSPTSSSSIVISLNMMLLLLFKLYNYAS